MDFPDDRVLKCIIALAFLLVVLDTGTYLLHMSRELPVFSALFGFAVAALIIHFSKLVEKAVKRDEDYYEKLRKGR